MAQGFHDSQFDADEELDTSSSKQGAGANLIALGRNPKNARVIVITVLAVLLVGFLLAATLVRRQQQVPPAPAPRAEVDVGRAPSDPPISRVQLAPGQDERTRELEAKAAAEAAAEARRNGESMMPSAERVEASLKPAMTPEEAALDAQRKAEAAAAQRRAEAAMAAASAAEALAQPNTGNPPSLPGQVPMRQPDPAQDARLARASEMVERILARTPPGSQTFQISQASMQVSEAGGTRGASQSGGVGAQSQEPADDGPVIIQAGTIEAMRIDTAINTDRGNRFRATLVTGPFKGAIVNGTYKLNAAGEAADLELVSLSLRDPKITVAAQGSGLDPMTWELGAATDVDRKLLVRYGVKPLASGFAAVAEYLRNAGTTVVVNNSSTTTATPPLTGKRTGQIVAGAAAGQLANDTEAMNTRPTARVARNSVVGVYFTADVRAKAEQK